MKRIALFSGNILTLVYSILLFCKDTTNSTAVSGYFMLLLDIAVFLLSIASLIIQIIAIRSNKSSLAGLITFLIGASAIVIVTEIDNLNTYIPYIETTIRYNNYDSFWFIIISILHQLIENGILLALIVLALKKDDKEALSTKLGQNIIFKKSFILTSILILNHILLGYLLFGFNHALVDKYTPDTLVYFLALGLPQFVIVLIAFIFFKLGNKHNKLMKASGILTAVGIATLWYAIIDFMLYYIGKNWYKSQLVLAYNDHDFAASLIYITFAILAVIYACVYKNQNATEALATSTNTTELDVVEDKKPAKVIPLKETKTETIIIKEKLIDYNKLWELKELLDSNAITEEEYKALKQKLLNL